MENDGKVIKNPRRTVALALVCILIILIFFKWIPMSFLSNWLIVSALVGSVLFAIVFGMFLFSFESQDYAEDGGSNTDMFKGIAAILSIFIFAIMLIRYETRFESHELEENGLYARGIVVDGHSTRIKRSTNYELTVKFRDQEGNVREEDITVGKGVFNNTYKKQPVILHYSPKYHEMVRLVSKNEEKLEALKILDNRPK